MSHSLGGTVRTLALVVGLLGLAVGAAAQTTETEKVVVGEPIVETVQLKGEVLGVGMDSIVAKMIPSGDILVFAVKPGRIFTIDGVENTLDQLVVGTILSADVVVTGTPVVDRIQTEVSGTVFWNSSTSVVLTLESGENKKYEIKPGVKFIVNGEEVTATELRQGMIVNAVKIVEEPLVLITHDAVVTGVAPK